MGRPEQLPKPLGCSLTQIVLGGLWRALFRRPNRASVKKGWLTVLIMMRWDAVLRYGDVEAHNADQQRQQGNC